MQIDRRNTARGADRLLSVDRDHEHRPVILLGDAARGEPENAFVPVVARENQHARGLGVSWLRSLAVTALRDRETSQPRDLLLRFFAHLLLHRLPFRIHAIELRAKLPGDVVVLCREQIDCRLGRGEAAGCVDARSDAEPDVYRS